MHTSVSLGEKTTDGILHTGKGYLAGVQIITDGAADATVVIFDGLTSAGVKIFEGSVVSTSLSGQFDFNGPVTFKTGMFLVITGGGASCIPYIM